MKGEPFVIPTEKLYVRVPAFIEGGEILNVVIPKSARNKTILVKVVDNDDAPFRRDALMADSEYSTLRYIGSDEYWQPEEVTLVVVAGNHDCTYEECCGECHNVSCGVFEGFSNEDPEEITYVRSSKVKHH